VEKAACPTLLVGSVLITPHLTFFWLVFTSQTGRKQAALIAALELPTTGIVLGYLKKNAYNHRPITINPPTTSEKKIA
jgi:hypothetical protein